MKKKRKEKRKETEDKKKRMRAKEHLNSVRNQTQQGTCVALYPMCNQNTASPSFHSVKPVYSSSIVSSDRRSWKNAYRRHRSTSLSYLAASSAWFHTDTADTVARSNTDHIVIPLSVTAANAAHR